MKALLDIRHLTFAHPQFFLLLVLIPFLLWLESKRKKKDKPVVRLTSLNGFKAVKPGLKVQLLPTLTALRMIAVAAAIIALARPQSTNTTVDSDTDGIDIVLGIDISGSMLAEDFKPNRIEATKQVAADFIDKRPGDRIGLVVYAGESFTMCPITIDHNILKSQLMQLKNGMIADGTSIGMGLATSVDRLRSSKAKSKVIILMTDGVNNVGLIDPNTAMEIAKAYKIKVYTIGVGSEGMAMTPMQGPDGSTTRQLVKVNIDEALLKQIAAQTGGKYFRARGNRSLQDIYDDIDKMEKTKINVTSFKHYAELFFPFAAIAIIALCLELILRFTVFRSITQ